MFMFVLQQSFSNFQTADQFSKQRHSWMTSQMLDVRHLHNQGVYITVILISKSFKRSSISNKTIGIHFFHDM